MGQGDKTGAHVWACLLQGAEKDREGQGIFPVLFPPRPATPELPAPDGREPAREETL